VIRRGIETGGASMRPAGGTPTARRVAWVYGSSPKDSAPSRFLFRTTSRAFSQSSTDALQDNTVALVVYRNRHAAGSSRGRELVHQSTTTVRLFGRHVPLHQKLPSVVHEQGEAVPRRRRYACKQWRMKILAGPSTAVPNEFGDERAGVVEELVR
jgi:hypothetical protein